MNIEFLKKYLDTPSPSGSEKHAQKVWADFISKTDRDKSIIDAYGSMAVIKNPDLSNLVVMEAHVDEIAWVVSYISGDGFIYVKKNGGSDASIAPSMRVKIWTSNGPVDGIFGHPAVHVRKKDDVTADSIFIDVGAASKADITKLGIKIGDNVTFADSFIEWPNHLVGRGLDNKIGGYIIAEVWNRFKNVDLDYGLAAVNCVQEEVGLRGAQMMASRLLPKIAIVIDVTHDTSAPGYNKKLNGAQFCGDGPVITWCPSVHEMTRTLLVNTAIKNKIQFQRKVASRSTGTNLESWAYTGSGIPSVLISLPLKYMHTTVEMVSKKDVDACIELIYQFLLTLSNEKIEKKWTF